MEFVIGHAQGMSVLYYWEQNGKQTRLQPVMGNTASTKEETLTLSRIALPFATSRVIQKPAVPLNGLSM
jgi:hypothetical protein